MKLTEEFAQNPNPPYNLPAGATVWSARFGRSAVDVWQEAEPGPIWRGEPKRIVGYWPEPLWHYVVRDEMSGVAATEAAARAKAEAAAWRSHANFGISPSLVVFRHLLAPDAATAKANLFACMLVHIDLHYPA